MRAVQRPVQMAVQKGVHTNLGRVALAELVNGARMGR